MTPAAVALLAAAGASAPPASAPASAALLAEPGRTVSASRDLAVRSFRIASTRLGETRKIHVVFPESYRTSARERRYPVTIVLDGEADVPPVAAASAELARNGQVPESLIVAVPNTDRLRDLTPPGLSVSGSGLDGGGDRFLDFLEKELLPAVDRELRGGGPRVLIGHSSGGILATYAAATRSLFGAVIAIDTPTELGDRWLPRKLTARAAAAAAPLRYASYEARFGWHDRTWEALVAAAPPTWKLHRERLAGESHESMVMLAAYLGLREVFRDYSMLAAPEAPTTSILPYYATVGAALGAPVIPPRKLVRNVVEDLLAEGRGAAAREAYGTLVSGYGSPRDGAALLAEIREVERRPAPAETVEGLLATPFPAPDEVKPYLGAWVGDVWMNPDEPRSGKTRLRLSVVDGRVVGETVDHLPTGEDLVRKWTHLRVTPAGLTWGFLNGMRPRGVLLHEATFDGETLGGQIRFGGVAFRMPDGTLPPPLRFAFRRAGG